MSLLARLTEEAKLRAEERERVACDNIVFRIKQYEDWIERLYAEERSVHWAEVNAYRNKIDGLKQALSFLGYELMPRPSSPRVRQREQA